MKDTSSSWLFLTLLIFQSKSIDLTIAKSNDEIDIDLCDSSQCLHRNGTGTGTGTGTSSDCWAALEGDNETIAEPLSCSDGYWGHLIGGPNLNHLGGITKVLDDTGIHYVLYACCPLDVSPPQCSNNECTSISVEGGSNCFAEETMSDRMTCSGKNGYKYPRRIPTLIPVLGDGLSSTDPTDEKKKTSIEYTCCTAPPGPWEDSYKYNYLVYDVFRIILASISLSCSASLVTGILISRSTREQANLIYLVGLAIPDFLFNLGSVMETCFGLAGKQYPVFLDVPVWEFYCVTNLWVNIMIAWDIFAILINSKRCRRVAARTVKGVCLRVGLVYVTTGAWSIFIAVLAVTNFEKVYSQSLYVTLVSLICSVFSLSYISLRTYCGKLLPLTGRTRVLAVYFFRIIASFFVLWLPPLLVCIIMYYTKDTDDTSTWFYYVVYVYYCQGIATFATALYNPDVKESVSMLWPCFCLRWISFCRSERPSSFDTTNDTNKSSGDEASKTFSRNTRRRRSLFHNTIDRMSKRDSQNKNSRDESESTFNTRSIKNNSDRSSTFRNGSGGLPFGSTDFGGNFNQEEEEVDTVAAPVANKTEEDADEEDEIEFFVDESVSFSIPSQMPPISEAKDPMIVAAASAATAWEGTTTSSTTTKNNDEIQGCFDNESNKKLPIFSSSLYDSHEVVDA